MPILAHNWLGLSASGLDAHIVVFATVQFYMLFIGTETKAGRICVAALHFTPELLTCTLLMSLKCYAYALSLFIYLFVYYKHHPYSTMVENVKLIIIMRRRKYKDEYSLIK